MTRRASISILICTISILTAQAQWNKQDSIRLQQLLNGEGELNINPEAVKSIHFDYKPEKEIIKGNPTMSQDKPWMRFLETLPKNFGDTTQWVKPKFVRLTPYTPYTKWSEDPIFDRVYAVEGKDSLKIGNISWKLNIKLDPSRMNGHVEVHGGMDPTITPSNSPLIGGMDANKIFYETFSKRGRAIRRNRTRANAWKTYKDYIPTRQDTVKKDTATMLRLLRRKANELHPGVADSLLIAPTDSLFLKNKINGKNQTNKGS